MSDSSKGKILKLKNCDLSYRDLSSSNLSYSIFENCNFENSNLSQSIFIRANLSNSLFYNANFSCSDLSDCILNNIKTNNGTSFFHIQCPEEGCFIGYKKVNKKIVTLLITEDAKRSSATSRKCRCNKAKVLSIQNINGEESDLMAVCSDYDNKFVYKIGEIVEVDNFNEDRWKERANGIHFFMTREEAIEYEVFIL